jgi:membrane protein implicated in regulation of membrane protease activity
MKTTVYSEFEMYQQIALRRRRVCSMYGRVLLMSGVGCLCVLMVLLPALVLSSPRYTHDLVVWSVLSAFSVGVTLAGFFCLRYAQKALTREEVEHVRRKERMRLYRQARGFLPWRYRIWGQIGIACVGLLLLVVGGTFLYLFGASAWDAWGYLILGVALLLVAFFFVPRRERHHLSQKSAQQLSELLMLGETQIDEDSNV